MGRIGATWGVAGTVAILAFAVWRLSAIAWEGFQYPFGASHWLLLIGNVAFMSYFEGFRGFQQGYSPRVAARAQLLKAKPTLLRVVLAPLFCMGYFGAERRRLVATYALTTGIVLLITIYQTIPQPWRGILDVGVVVGLAWGIVSIVAFSVRALFETRAVTECPQR